MTADPAGDGLNWYSYTGGDPVNGSDPSGLLTCRELLADVQSRGGSLGGCIGLGSVQFLSQVSAGAQFIECAPGSQTCVDVVETQLGIPYMPVPNPTGTSGGSGASGVLPQSQIDYESGGCSTPAGLPCYQVDAGMRKLNTLSVESCGFVQSLAGWCEDADLSTALPLIPRTTSLGMVLAAIGAQMAARLMGTAGERVVGAIINLPSNTRALAGNGRIPDFINLANRTLYEVKNVGYQSFTAQLRDMSGWAINNGYRFQLWVNNATTLSSEVKRAEELGLIEIHRFICTECLSISLTRLKCQSWRRFDKRQG
jgi:hypothetical protein